MNVVWKRSQLDRRVNRAKNMNLNTEHLANHCKRRAESKSSRRADPVYRNLEQAATTDQRSNGCTDPEYRIEEQSYNTARRVNAHTNSEMREEENGRIWILNKDYRSNK
jgi:hypothetical protein